MTQTKKNGTNVLSITTLIQKSPFRTQLFFSSMTLKTKNIAFCLLQYKNAHRSSVVTLYEKKQKETVKMEKLF